MTNTFLVPLLFFCSGATALVYEVIWSKYLGQMMGSTVQAQTVVLAVFMGGLAIGNKLFGGIAGKAGNPLALYGYLELAIGLYGFFFPQVYKVADAVFLKIGTGLLDHPTGLLCLKGGLSVALLILPTILMGGTLPLIASWLQRRSEDHGRWSARFYSINSLGAVAGAALAGFLIVRSLGMVSGLQVTGLVNTLIWVVALALSKSESTRLGKVSSATQPAEKESVDSAEAKTASWHFGQKAGLVVAMTGGISMGLEVLASRSLTLIFGASLHAFAVVLMAFILGIGLGGSVIASPRVRSWPMVPAVLGALLGASLLLSAYVFYIEEWVEVYRHLRSGIARSTMGYTYHVALNTLLSLVVLGIPAGLLGAVLPLFIREGSGGNDLARKLGNLLTWNTVGAVVGVLLTGFVVMPQLGLRASFGFMAALLAAAASVIGFQARSRRGTVLGLAATAAALVVIARGNDDWRYVFSSGVFRNRETDVVGNAVDIRKQHVSVLFYKDAPDATVSVEKNILLRPGEIVLRVNGKPDASSRGDLATQYLLAHLPLLSKPDSEDVFILGFGSGITAGAAVTHPLKSLTIAENCAPVLEAGSYFETFNRGVLKNPLTRVVREDARTVLKLDPKKYDVIISEPSNPWMAGVGSVFSTEFYQLAASRLKEGGLMAQWFHIYEVNDGIVNLVLRTFASVFPVFEIWDAYEGDIILVGSQKPWRSPAAGYEAAFARPLVARDLAEIGLTTPQSLWVRQLSSARTAWAIPGPGPMQSDAFPVLEYEAPRAFYVGTKSEFLTTFDERTWLSPLASEHKRVSLPAISNEALRPIFSEFGTSNPDVVRYLNMRFRGQDTLSDYANALKLRPIPSIFRGDPQWRNALTSDEPGLKEATPLVYAEKLIMGEPKRWREAVELIRSTLGSATADSQQNGGGTLPLTHYASLGAITCLSHGEIDMAKSLIGLGLSRNPSHVTLNFLGRLSSMDALFQKPQ